MSAREELIEIVTRDKESSGGDRVWATDLVDALLHEEAEKIREQRGELDDLSSPDAVVFFLADLIDPYTRTKWVELNDN